jgi:hypothetical protein
MAARQRCVHTRGGRGWPFIGGRARQGQRKLRLEGARAGERTRGRRSRVGCRPADRGAAAHAPIASRVGGHPPTSDTVGDGGTWWCDSYPRRTVGRWGPDRRGRRQCAGCRVAAQRDVLGAGSRARAPGCRFISKYPTLTEPNSNFLLQLQIRQKAKLYRSYGRKIVVQVNLCLDQLYEHELHAKLSFMARVNSKTEFDLNFWAISSLILKCHSEDEMCPMKNNTSSILFDFWVFKQNLENVAKVPGTGVDIKGFDYVD